MNIDANRKKRIDELQNAIKQSNGETKQRFQEFLEILLAGGQAEPVDEDFCQEIMNALYNFHGDSGV